MSIQKLAWTSTGGAAGRVDSGVAGTGFGTSIVFG